MKERLLLVALIVLQSSHLAFASSWLFKNGKSDYQIVVSNDASISEKTAAHELQSYIYQISGVTIPISSIAESKYRHVYIGHSPAITKLLGASKPNHEDESYTYYSGGNDLFIWGGSHRGTMYGVFSFIERELGVHWLTPDCTTVPHRNSWKMPRLNHSENSAIEYRYSNYYFSIGRTTWFAHNKENMRGPGLNTYGDQEGYWGCHTMGQLVNGKEFFESHPEYFCRKRPNLGPSLFWLR